ncbi:MAG: hypothetical protein NVSMB27_44690 [Ktedonobacteraceae bacterium]
MLSDPSNLAEALRRAQGGNWLPQEMQARREQHRKALAALTAQMERLTEAYLAGVFPMEEYRQRRQELEQRLIALDQQHRLVEAQTRQQMEVSGICEALTDFCQRVQAGLAEATFEQKRQLVELLIDRVVVTMDEVEIRYVIPTSPRSEHIRFCHLHTDYFHPNFIRLHVHQVQSPLFNDFLMHLLTMGSCSITPICHGSFIQPVSMHNGLHWASIRQEGDDNHNEIPRFAQALQHRSSTGTEGLFADLTAVALPFAIMNADVALCFLASCGTHLIRAKLLRRIHRLCTCLHMLQYAYGCLLFQPLLPFSPDSGVLPVQGFCDVFVILGSNM